MGAASKLSESALNEFLAECEEITQRTFLNLESFCKGGGNSELIDSIYRDIHTLKGSAQLYGYQQMGNIAHAMETSLDPLRSGTVSLNAEFADALIKCLDVIDEIVKSIKGGDVSDVRSKMETVIPHLIQVGLESVGLGAELQKEFSGVTENLDLKKEVSQSVDGELVVDVHSPENSSEITELVVESNGAPPEGSGKVSAHGESGAEVTSTIRVSVSLLDKLMALMGEMVLVRNQVLQFTNSHDDLELLNLSQRLDLVTSELQGEVMKTRMQPIGNVLTKLKRVVHDLSKDLSKQIDISLHGTETELDKTLLEAIRDPLTHIIRNACDHGLEVPDERIGAGKSKIGTISVRSFHEGGQVIVEIEDDGRGLQKKKIVAKALEKNIISQDHADAITQQEAYNLIFAPGFSTAEKVTNVSGRGVGMDVVKTNIEKIGGTIEITSNEGKGTTIRLKIPLTLAIVPAMIIECASMRYAIPQVKLVELVRVDHESKEQVETLEGRPVYRLRGQLLPLLDLKEVLRLQGLLEAGEQNAETERAKEAVNIVVVNADNQLFGLIVDKINDTADIVVKPLSRFLKKIPVYSGATVMGDGSVALILDVSGILQSMCIEQRESIEERTNNTDAIDMDQSEFLLFRLNSSSKHAIPLNLVHRLEEFDQKAVEYSGEQPVVRYRNTILPIVDLNEYLHMDSESWPGKNGPTSMDKREQSSARLPVIVSKKGDRLFGIRVNEILDVLRTSVDVDSALSDREGIAGNLMTDDEVVVVVDALNVLDKSASRLLKGSAQREERSDSLDRARWQVLLVEDTPFFRKQVERELLGAGYRVITAVDGKDAISKLNALDPMTPLLIVSDIEMPKMDGYALAKEIRNHPDFSKLPLVAFTSKFSEQDRKRGKESGFDQYLEKTSIGKLIDNIDNVVRSGRRS